MRTRPNQEQIDRLWAEESERRIARIDRGDVELVPGEEVFNKIRGKYRRRSSTSTRTPNERWRNDP